MLFFSLDFFKKEEERGGPYEALSRNHINHTNHTNHINHICLQREKEGSQNIKRRKGGPLQNWITPITPIEPITSITSITSLWSIQEKRRAAGEAWDQSSQTKTPPRDFWLRAESANRPQDRTLAKRAKLQLSKNPITPNTIICNYYFFLFLFSSFFHLQKLERGDPYKNPITITKFYQSQTRRMSTITSHIYLAERTRTDMSAKPATGVE